MAFTYWLATPIEKVYDHIIGEQLKCNITVTDTRDDSRTKEGTNHARSLAVTRKHRRLGRKKAKNPHEVSLAPAPAGAV